MLKTHDRRDATRTQRYICDQLELWYSQFCVLVLVLVLVVTAQQRVSARLTHRASRRYRDTLMMMMKMMRRWRISREEDDAAAADDELRETRQMRICVCVCVCETPSLSLSDRSGLGAFCRLIDLRGRARVCCVIDLKGVSFLHPFYYDQNISSSSKVSL